MGAAINLIMEKGEKKRLLSAVRGAVEYKPEGDARLAVGCWINDGNGNRVNIEYQSGCGHRELALAIAWQICKQYKVRRGGWDNVGYLEPVEKFSKYRAFDIDIKRVKKYLRQLEKMKPSKDATRTQIRTSHQFYSTELELTKQQQKAYEARAKEILKV